MDISIFNSLPKVIGFNKRYAYYRRQMPNSYSFYIVFGEFYSGALTQLHSTPREINLPLISYSEVIVQIWLASLDERNAVKQFALYKQNDGQNGPKCFYYLMPPDKAVEMLSIILGSDNNEQISIQKEFIAQPCFKCKLNDKWNSLGKDGNWYCYNHCNY